VCCGSGKYRCALSCSDLSVELPFTLTHPKPPESPQSSRPPSTVPPTDAGDSQVPVDTNLIQLDTEYEKFSVTYEFNFPVHMRRKPSLFSCHMCLPYCLIVGPATGISDSRSRLLLLQHELFGFS